LAPTLWLRNDEFPIGRTQYLRLFGVLLILGVATYAMYVVGFWIRLLVALIQLQLVAGQRNPMVLVLFSAALVCASWILLDMPGLYITAPTDHGHHFNGHIPVADTP